MKVEALSTQFAVRKLLEEDIEMCIRDRDVSFTLKKGQTLAVVGENGSGKSTLVRLISGLYTPTEGRVLHNSRDTRELSMQALFLSLIHI